MRTRLEEAIDWLVEGRYGRTDTYLMSRAAFKDHVAAYLIGALYEYAAYRVFKYNRVLAPGTWLGSDDIIEEKRVSSIDFLSKLASIGWYSTPNFNRAAAVSDVMGRILPKAREFFHDVEVREFPARFGKVAPRRLPAKTLTRAVKAFAVDVAWFLREVH